MDRRPTPDPGATESAPKTPTQQETDRERDARGQFVENEGLASREESGRLARTREAAAQRGHSAN
jgi:hypothetical protein